MLSLGKHNALTIKLLGRTTKFRQNLWPIDVWEPVCMWPFIYHIDSSTCAWKTVVNIFCGELNCSLVMYILF